MRFAAGSINRSFGIKEESVFFGAVFEILNKDSGLLDIFYCHGVVGIVVLFYLQQIVYRNHYYLELCMHYVTMLSAEDKQKLVDYLLSDLN